MKAGDLQSVLEVYEAIRARDLDAVIERVGDDTEIQTRIESYRGKEAAAGMFREAFAGEFDNDQDGFILSDGVVVALTRLRLVGWSTGIESHEQVLEVWRVEHGQVRELRVMNHQDGLRELGLEQPAAEVAALVKLYDLLARGDRGGAANIFPGLDVDLSELGSARPEPIVHNGRRVAALIGQTAHVWTMQEGRPVAIESVDGEEALPSICVGTMPG